MARALRNAALEAGRTTSSPHLGPLPHDERTWISVVALLQSISTAVALFAFLQSVTPQEFKAVLVKGRGNYLSKRRLRVAQQRMMTLTTDRRAADDREAWLVRVSAGFRAVREQGDQSIEQVPRPPSVERRDGDRLAQPERHEGSYVGVARSQERRPVVEHLITTRAGGREASLRSLPGRGDRPGSRSLGGSDELRAMHLGPRPGQ